VLQRSNGVAGFLRAGEQRGAGAPASARPPVLLVPPLAAPATCFDLRRGCSVAEHLLAAGHPTYLVDYGAIAFGDRNLGIEHWIDEVIPRSIDAVLADAGAEPVQLVGWCLGGIMALLAAAADLLREHAFRTAVTWVFTEDAALRAFLEPAGWAPDGARRTLDLGRPVEMLRLHTSLA